VQKRTDNNKTSNNRKVSKRECCVPPQRQSVFKRGSNADVYKGKSKIKEEEEAMALSISLVKNWRQ
jgi:hypothetical protein